MTKIECVQSVISLIQIKGPVASCYFRLITALFRLRLLLRPSRMACMILWLVMCDSSFAHLMCNQPALQLCLREGNGLCWLVAQPEVITPLSYKCS